jgi:uncharacterized protein (TIGR00251 family)
LSQHAWCSALPGGIRLAVQITPNAKKTEVIGVLDDALKLKLQAQPIEGKANDALVRFLAEVLKVPRSAITITHGQTSKKKLLEIKTASLTPADVEKILLS